MKESITWKERNILSMLNLSIGPLKIAIYIWFHFSRKDKCFKEWLAQMSCRFFQSYWVHIRSLHLTAFLNASNWWIMMGGGIIINLLPFCRRFFLFMYPNVAQIIPISVTQIQIFRRLRKTGEKQLFILSCQHLIVQYWMLWTSEHCSARSFSFWTLPRGFTRLFGKVISNLCWLKLVH